MTFGVKDIFLGKFWLRFNFRCVQWKKQYGMKTLKLCIINWKLNMDWGLGRESLTWTTTTMISVCIVMCTASYLARGHHWFYQTERASNVKSYFVNCWTKTSLVYTFLITILILSKNFLVELFRPASWTGVLQCTALCENKDGAI